MKNGPGVVGDPACQVRVIFIDKKNKILSAQTLLKITPKVPR